VRLTITQVMPEDLPKFLPGGEAGDIGGRRYSRLVS
jgi:hypothetical protein